MEEILVERKAYLARLGKFRDTKLFKVITGIRRVGKSVLMRLFMRNLLELGVSEQNIIFINFEILKYDTIRDYRALYQLIMDTLPPEGRNYIFLDEIQHVKQWEKAINSIREETGADIYLTGSNAWMLSSEISTLLSGRYVEVEVFPLSFKEYLDFELSGTPEERFNQYLKYGAFPAIPALPQDNQTINNFLLGIYNTVIVKDVLSRQLVKDIKTFQQLVKFLAQNTGNYVSSSKISGFLTAEEKGEAVKSSTISNYLDLLEKSFIIYPAYRYDIKGKELLKTLCKYYIVDTGLRNMLLGYGDTDLGHVLETVVFFELRRRGYQVFCGKLYSGEVDFLAVRQDEKKYFQVAATIMDTNTREREMAPLLKINDNYEKTILSLDRNYIGDFRGIKNRNLIDFLLE
ncbi:MAG: ATP-binding protein [Treponema sp.]|jgi:predicted AAA+ superfamily ATPase|nr:ATP-binding protein [Treponema sp.]